MEFSVLNKKPLNISEFPRHSFDYPSAPKSSSLVAWRAGVIVLLNLFVGVTKKSESKHSTGKIVFRAFLGGSIKQNMHHTWKYWTLTLGCQCPTVLFTKKGLNGPKCEKITPISHSRDIMAKTHRDVPTSRSKFYWNLQHKMHVCLNTSCFLSTTGDLFIFKNSSPFGTLGGLDMAEGRTFERRRSQRVAWNATTFPQTDHGTSTIIFPK